MPASGFDPALVIAVGVAFAVAIAVLGVLWRRVSAQVDLERADRLLEEEFDSLERRVSEARQPPAPEPSPVLPRPSPGSRSSPRRG